MFSLAEGVVTCGQILLGRGREKKYLFTCSVSVVVVVVVVIVVLPVRAGQHRRVGGLELQTDEDMGKKSTA